MNQKPKHVKKKTPPRFPGVSAAAKALGCTRGHLWAVLAGQRVSHSLMRRYAELESIRKGSNGK